jgi:hypothetical protein
MLRKLLPVVVAMLLSIANAAGQDGALDVRAKVAVLSPSRIALELTLRNPGLVPLDLFAADVPWGTRQSLMLVPVTNDRETRRIDEALYIDDPKPGQVSVKAGGQLSGIVDLSRRFPTLLEVLKTREVIVFWSFQPTPVNGTPLDRTSGAVVLPKQ